MFFAAIHEKLNDPEWEVRQHTLRLLRDFIKTTDSSCVNNKTENIFDDLIGNLGHINPAVRKAAIDCLRNYLKQNENIDGVIRNLIKKVIEDSNAETNVQLGVILALPFLIVSNISSDTILYIIEQVIRKINEETYREAAIRTLIRMRCVVGKEKFSEFLKMCSSTMPLANFEELSATYDLNMNNQNFDNVKENRSILWSDFNDNLLDELDDSLQMNGIVEDRVILETEIQLNSGPAVTMQLHEQSRQNSFNETTDSEEDAR